MYLSGIESVDSTSTSASSAFASCFCGVADRVALLSLSWLDSPDVFLERHPTENNNAIKRTTEKRLLNGMVRFYTHFTTIASQTNEGAKYISKHKYIYILIRGYTFTQFLYIRKENESFSNQDVGNWELRTEGYK